jgi:hypothetical protein
MLENVTRRGSLSVLALGLTVGLGLFSGGTATADENDVAGPLPLSVALATTELPPVGVWDVHQVRPKKSFELAQPTCWSNQQLLGETDGIIEDSMVSRPGNFPYYYAERSQVLRFRDTAAANAAAARWHAAVADCEIPNDSPYPNGQLFIQNLRVVATVSGVDVWGYDCGASGYTPPGHTEYVQFFLVQRENVLYFGQLNDSVTVEPHPVIPVADTVAAVQRHLDALSW